jgi:phage-related protein
MPSSSSAIESQIDNVSILIHPLISMKLTALFYRTDAGGEPVRNWLLDLSKPDRKLLGEAVMQVQFGWPVGRPLCASLGAGLYEVRKNISGNRTARILFCFAEAHEIILLHAFIKKTQKTPAADIDLARHRMR